MKEMEGFFSLLNASLNFLGKANVLNDISLITLILSCVHLKLIRTLIEECKMWIVVDNSQRQKRQILNGHKSPMQPCYGFEEKQL